MQAWTSFGGAGLALALGLFAGAGPAACAEPPSIVVEGEATATVVPDTATLTLGVEAERPHAADATAAVAAAASSLRATLAAQGVQPADIATAAVSLFPVYPDDTASPGKASAPVFRAGTLYHVTVKPVDRVGPLLSGLVQAGATTVQGIAFSATTAETRRDELRGAALRDARHKADIYAAAAGLHLGPVIEIIPGRDAEPAPPVMMRAAMAAKAPAMPVEPGTLTLQASVSVRWGLVP